MSAYTARDITDVLQPETIHWMLSYLDAKTLGRAAVAARLLVVLCDDHYRRPGLEARLGPMLTVARDLLPSLPARPNMGFLFANEVPPSQSAAESALASSLSALPLSCCVVGAVSPSLQVQVGGQLACTEGSTEGPSAPEDLQASLLLGTFPDATFKQFHLSADAFEVAAAQGGSDGAAFLRATGLNTGPENNDSCRSSSSSSGRAGGNQDGAVPPGSPPAWSVFVVLICGVGGVGTDRVLHGLQTKFPNSAIVGGVCGGVFSRNPYTGAVSYSEEGVVGMAMAGNVPLQALVTRGAKPLGAAQLVTKCSSVSSPSGTPYLLLERASAILHEEDDSNQGSVAGSGRRGSGSSNRSNNRSAEAASANDRNVMAALQEALYASGGDGGGGMGMYYLGLQVNSSTSSSNSRSSANSTSQSRSDGSEGYELHPLSNNDMFQRNGIVVPDPGAPPGATLKFRIYQLDETYCRTDAAAQLTRAKNELETAHRSLMGALLFSCGGRGPHAFGGVDMMDAHAFQNVFPTSPLTGFYAGGEIGPRALAQASGAVATQTGGATLQGFTAVFGLFSVPAAMRRPSSQLPSTLDTTQAGLADYLRKRPKLPRHACPVLPAPPSQRQRQQGSFGQSSSNRRADNDDDDNEESGEPVPSADEVESMSIKALKSLIVRARMSHVDCLEKAELRTRALEAVRALSARSQVDNHME